MFVFITVSSTGLSHFTSEAKLSSISLPCHLQNYKEEYLVHSKECKICQKELKPFVRHCQCFKSRRCSIPCDVCGKYFDCMFLLERHVPMHDKLVEINCEVCGMKFKNISNLKIHLLKHRFNKISFPNFLDLMFKLGIICV